MKEMRKKITLKEFFNNTNKNVAIHCNTIEKANILLKEFDKLGKRWCSGESYVNDNKYNFYKKNTCYAKQGSYCDIDYFKKQNYTIYKFEDIIFNEEKMDKFKVGDRVRNEHKGEGKILFIYDVDDKILVEFDNMFAEGHNGHDLYKQKGKNGHCWYYTKSTIRELELINNYPTIISHEIKGKEIIIKLSNGKIGKAKCCDKDEFDIAIGTTLAIERAYKELNFKFDVDDYIKIINSGETYNDYESFIRKYCIEYLDSWVEHKIPDKNNIHKIIFRGKHEYCNDINLYITQDIKTKKVYIIGEEGLEKY